MNEEKLIWTTEKRKVNDLIPYEYNPRQLTEQEAEKLRKSIERFNLVEIPAVDADNKIIAGHQRVNILQMLNRGEEEIDVRVPNRKLTLEEFQIYNIGSNKISGDWDYDLLANLDERTLMESGFESEEIDDIFTEKESIEDDADNIPEPKEARAKLGDLYQLGEHRLLCGDSTKKEDVDRLMAGQKADICITDRPYSVDYKSRKESPDESLKSYHDPKDAKELLSGFMKIMPCNGLIMTYADKQLHDYILTLEELNWETIDLLIWVKQNFTFWPGTRYQQRHELIFLARKVGASFYSNTPANQSTVFEISRQIKNDLHPTIRPLELWQKLVLYHSKRGEVIYEPFAGSGTTFIASENLNRICYGIEISPYFCDTIIERWEKLTGKKAERITG